MNDTLTTVPTYTSGTIYIPYQNGCPVCGGKGYIYGLDGIPYLCPKCHGNPYPYQSPIITWGGYTGDSPYQDRITMCNTI
jgi:DnaJ-class molecular chaperone